MTVCIQYSRPASGQGDSEIFGMDVAVNNFLSAYFRYSTYDKFICRPTDIPSFDHFKALAQATGIDAEKRCIGIDPRHPQHNLENISCLFRPDPLTVDLTWRRQQVEGTGFATCGLVHTMSGERIARVVGELCIAPTDASDALICPSEAVRDAVRNLWDIYSEYLNHHFGTTYKCPVQTPVIPLGIDTERFVRRTTPAHRKAQREALGVTDDEVVILFVGRLSFATKAHPLPLFMAAERAAKRLKRKIRLVMFGYYKPQDMETHFQTLVSDIAKSVQIDFIMNDDTRFPEGLWAAADIFTSLSDNIQESFGLTPIEAMAAGLPTVITDWDGYRGGVRHDVDGFLIPTLAPPPKAGMAIAEGYYNTENYAISLMGAAQSTAIDIERCADAFVALAQDDNRRQQFGQSARRRAHDTYDWKHIIASYQNLWQELGEKRVSMSISAALPRHWQAAHPSFPNPLEMFKSFPSKSFTYQDRIQAVMPKDEIAMIMKHDMNYFLPEFLVGKESMIELIEAIRRAGSPQVQDILATFPVAEHDRLLRCIGWMLKHGTCVLVA